MSTSSPPRHRPREASRASGRNPPPKRSRMRVIRFSLIVATACGTLAIGAFFVFCDDLFSRLIGHQTQTQINYEDQIADLRAQINRVSQLDQERVEQQIKPLLRRQATLEEVTSVLAKEPSIQPRNSLPASGAIGTGPSLSAVETPSPPIGATSDVGSAKQADQPTIQSESKGYIMYVNSPAIWTPVPLPDEVTEAAHAPRNNNIRAEIERAAVLFDVDVRMMKSFAEIESDYNPKARTGRYKGLFQRSDWEVAKYCEGANSHSPDGA